jgi:hypothetical protein
MPARRGNDGAASGRSASQSNVGIYTASLPHPAPPRPIFGTPLTPDFTKCLEATNGDMTSCSYYLEALKACQAAARPF